MIISDDFTDSDVHALEEANGREQAECLAADGFKIGQPVKHIVVKVLRGTSVHKLLPEVVLNVEVQGE